MANEQARLDYLGSIFDLRGKSALVTGAGSGLGHAIATALAQAGASVLIGDFNAETAELAARQLREGGATATAAVIDVGDRAQVEAGFDAAEQAHGPIDIVFANAGISGGPSFQRGGELENVTAENWDRTLRTNLSGVFFTMQAAARRMRGRGGRIVVTSSVAGVVGDAMVGYPYIASKAAVVNLVRQAALDLASDNVLVNAILPGPFQTNIGQPRSADPTATVAAPTDGRTTEERWSAFAATVPLRRVATTDEMRGLALFLASPASSFVTGTTFAIDGGALAGRS